jgi:asparagine synthase (glutamine-hydrolysing)
MCGIAGLVSTAGAPLPHGPVVERMCALMRHRGPDALGVHRAPFAHVGMRRLAIIDLSGGQQPMANEDGTVRVVFNGMIYNYVELRTELKALGHVFRTDSDTECIVHAYEAWGDDAFTRLRGMFAIAVVDDRTRRVVLARDRLGKKPLYWTRLGDRSIAFASELKCLFAVPGFERRLDDDAVRTYAALGYVPAPASILAGTRKLRPGHLMVIEGDHTAERPYWSLEWAVEQGVDDREWVERLHAGLDEAVRIRLRSDVPFGAFLSGGLDSSVVAALMARHMQRPVETFTIGFREAAFSELPAARAVAAHIGARHHELVVEPDAAALVPKLAWHLDEPFADSSSIPTFLVSELAGRHVKMVLSGDGGDELFGGYERYRRFAALRGMTRATLGLGPPIVAAAACLVPGLAGWRLRRIAARAALPWPRDYLSMVALASADDLAMLLHPARRAGDPFATMIDRFPSPDGELALLDSMAAGDIASYLPDDVLVKVDRMTMAASIEARAPILDHCVAELAARMPSRVKLRDGRGKWVLREVARGLLPASILDRPKQGFAIPLSDWLRGPLREMVGDLLGDTRFRERGVFDAGHATRMLDAHLAGHADHGEHLWSMLAFESWARALLDAPPDDDDPEPVASRPAMAAAQG